MPRRFTRCSARVTELRQNGSERNPGCAVRINSVLRTLIVAIVIAIFACVRASQPQENSSSSKRASASPTYYRDVVPILQQHCQSCHRVGEIGPMPLMTYEQTRPFAARYRCEPSANAKCLHGSLIQLLANSRTIRHSRSSKSRRSSPGRMPAHLRAIQKMRHLRETGREVG